MTDIISNYQEVIRSIPNDVTLVAVSKTYPVTDIQEIYEQGQRDFGENKVQELLSKVDELPQDIRWHLIGHLQTNKVKSVLGKVHLIQSGDRIKLLNKIQTESQNLNIKTSILLQLKIAQEDSKYGLNEVDFEEVLEMINKGAFPNLEVKGLMGMATYTADVEVLQAEFQFLHKKYIQYAKKYSWTVLSMGMSGDYELAIQQGSNMVRVGSKIFGVRI